MLFRSRSHIFGWTWGAYDRGDFKATRKRLRMSWDLGQFGVREAGYWVATFLPPRLVTALRRWNRAVMPTRQPSLENGRARITVRQPGAGRSWPDDGRSVSVVIPCYNGESYLREALESIRAQTVPAHEIIVVDDGSTVPLAPPPNWSGPPLHIVRIANQGQAAARNKGLARASGAFIALMDADDTWDPRKLEAQVQAMGADDTAVACYTRCAKGPGLFPFGPYPPGNVSGSEFLLMLWYHSFFPPSAVMFRRAAIAEVGFFDEELRGPEDIEYWFRLMTAGRFVQVPEALCFYRQHAAQFTADLYRKIAAGKRARQTMIPRYSEYLVRAGLRRDMFWDAYRNEVLIAYYRRQFQAARPLLWDYWKDHPADVTVLVRAAVALMPESLVTRLRGRLDSPDSRLSATQGAGRGLDPGWWSREFERIAPALVGRGGPPEGARR